MERQLIENKINDILLQIIIEWESKFDLLGVRIEKSGIKQNNSTIDYFSELEVDFWNRQNNNLITTTSIIIFMNNELVMNVENAYSLIEQEMKECYLECQQITKVNNIKY